MTDAQILRRAVALLESEHYPATAATVREFAACLYPEPEAIGIPVRIAVATGLDLSGKRYVNACGIDDYCSEEEAIRETSNSIASAFAVVAVLPKTSISTIQGTVEQPQ